MKKFISLLFSLAIVALSLHAHAAPLTQPPVKSFIVKMKDASAAASLSLPRNTHMGTFSAVAQRTMSFEKTMSGGASVLKLSEAISPAEAEDLARHLSQQDGVEYVSPNYRRYPTAAPNDAFYTDQWFLQPASTVSGSANLQEAWDINPGDGTVIAVVDTGYLAHVDLDNIILPGYDFWNLPASGYYPGLTDNDATDGRDADALDPGDYLAIDECGTGEPTSVKPSSWHGTHVAGIISANTNNATGVAGVNQAAGILPVRVLGKCGGLDVDIIDGMRWAAGLSVPSVVTNQNPAKIINLSLGGLSKCTDAYESAISEIMAAGATLVYAAGNENKDVSTSAPANCARGITVASVARSGAKSSFSNYGTGIDIAAPGGEHPAVDSEKILSLGNAGATVPAADTYAYEAGTSMAAPVVSGILGLMLAEFPGLSPVQLEISITKHVRPFPAVAGACTTATCGAGIVDAHRVLQAIESGDIPGIYTGSGGGTKIESIKGASTGGSISWLWLLSLGGLLLVRRVAAHS